MKIRTQVQFESAQYRRLKEAARASGISMSEAIRRIVQEHFDVGAAKKPSSHKAAMSFVGKGHDSASDVAERHDAYLAGLE